MLLLLAVILKGQSRILLFCFAFLSAWCLSLPKFLAISSSVKGFSGGLSGKETDWQGRSQRKHRFDPWVSKIPWRRKWQPTPVSLPGKSHGQRSLAGYSCGVTKSRTWLKWLSTHNFKCSCIGLHTEKIIKSTLSYEWMHWLHGYRWFSVLIKSQ